VTDSISTYITSIRNIKNRVNSIVLWKINIFLITSIALFISSLLIINSFRYIEKNLVLVSEQPLSLPILIFVLILALYLALSNLTLVSQEYGRGTLDILMFGPVDEIVFIMGNFVAYIEIFFYEALLLFVWTNICVWAYNLTFSFNVVLILFGAIFVTGELIAFGSLLAVLGGKTRNAILYFVLVLLLFGGIKAVDTTIATFLQINSSSESDAVLFIRNILLGINNLINWISPFAHIERIIGTVLDTQYLDYLLIIILILIEIIIFLGSAIFALRRKGARS